MTITEKVRKKLIMLHAGIADILAEIKAGTCPVGKITRIIRAINDSIVKLDSLPRMFEAAAINAKLPGSEKAIIVDRAKTAKANITKFLVSVKEKLGNLEQDCPGMVIESLEHYIVMSDNLIENRIKHLTDELDEAEAMVRVAAAAEEVFA